MIVCCLLFFGSAIFAAGVAILYKNNSSSGGTTIPPLIFQKYFHINPSIGLLATDAVVVTMSLLVFGFEEFFVCDSFDCDYFDRDELYRNWDGPQEVCDDHE